MLNEPDTDDLTEVPSTPRVSLVGVVPRPRRTSSGTSRASTGDEGSRLEFLQLTLHDLQSSVAVLDVSATLLAGDLADAEPSVRATLADIQRATFRVQQYIDHLVTSERLGSGGLEPRREHVELVALLESVAADYEQHARASSATIELDLGSSKIGLRADGVLLRRVVQNLVENALRHVEKGGRVLVQARAASIVELRVCNDGPPIPEFVRDRIFNMFHVTANGRGVTGLGLHFCKAAVQAHGGTIALEEVSDGLTCFVVRLPRAAI